MAAFIQSPILSLVLLKILSNSPLCGVIIVIAVLLARDSKYDDLFCSMSEKAEASRTRLIG